MDRFDAMLDEVRAEVVGAEEASLRVEAERFLEGLDHDSDVGLWFQEFAAAFPTALGAAVVYVRELRASPGLQQRSALNRPTKA